METIQTHNYLNVFACTAPKDSEFMCSNCDTATDKVLILVLTGHGAIKRVFLCEDCVQGLVKLFYESQ